MKIKMWSFITGFWQDQNGNSSSKRITLFVLLYFLKALIDANIGGIKIDSNILYGVFLGIFICLGVITSEFFKNGIGGYNNQKSQEVNEEGKKDDSKG